MEEAAREHVVVVGVDGSPAARAALRWGAWHAKLVGGTIIAVMAWDMPLIYNWEVPDSADFARRTAAGLDAEITEALGDEPGIEIHKEVAAGHAARSLLDAAEEFDATLIAVGDRGHGGFAPALLGSVSQHVVHHAHCPVIILREDES